MLVVGQAMCGRDFPKAFAPAVAFYYAGNALGAPVWGLLGTSGSYAAGMYAAPVRLAIFVAGAAVVTEPGRARYTALTDQENDIQAARD